MPPRAKELFDLLRDRNEITNLLNTPENLYLDCKEWPLKKEDEGWNTLSKAFCGFANADGGVVVIGLATERKGKYDPDVITSEKPVPDALYLQSRIEGIVGELVEPPLRGIETHATLAEPATGNKSGFVVIYIPATEGFPARSRRTGLFHQRIASGTYGMEYFQIADMFGRRRRPGLEFWLESPEVRLRIDGGRPLAERTVVLGLRNVGRGIAKFPGIRIHSPSFQPAAYGLDGNGFLGLGRVQTERDWIAFGGGADDVIYPGTVRRITKFIQQGRLSGVKTVSLHPVHVFNSAVFTVELFAEDMEVKTAERTIEEDQISE